MSGLFEKKCVPCEKGGKPLDADKIALYIKETPDWNVLNNKKIRKNFTFKDFKEALGFTNEIGDIAEHEGHHPDIFIHNWNQVEVSLSTHSIKGLSENDFIIAAKIDKAHKENK